LSTALCHTRRSDRPSCREILSRKSLWSTWPHYRPLRMLPAPSLASEDADIACCCNVANRRWWRASGEGPVPPEDEDLLVSDSWCIRHSTVQYTTA
jgi:hypothetical protein